MSLLMDFRQLYKKYNLNITGIIHIGAHYGDELGDYIDHGVQNIILFEPLSNNFDKLRENCMDLNVNIEAHNVALGSKEGNATMYLSDNDTQSSSILKPKIHIKEMPWINFEGTEEVEVKTLDSYNIKGYNFINIDVQGYEMEVFKGGKNTLEGIDYIYSEVNKAELYEGCAQIGELDSFLGNYGFERVETYWPEDWYNWGDALYIKKK
tara:strand:- start:1164 stop:1790 length:627 start_codon:yes stop_codon:yes gene_type:complete